MPLNKETKPDQTETMQMCANYEYYMGKIDK